MADLSSFGAAFIDVLGPLGKLAGAIVKFIGLAS